MNDVNMLENISKNARSWPFVEAKKVLKKINNKVPKKGFVLFETGYGPSGLPHIGTFGEVARTTMVINAFKVLTNGKIPIKLIVFSDDMDGMRKVPENIPNKDDLEKQIGVSLSKVKDPFNKFSSFAEHNNNKLKEFLDKFSFNYDFFSSYDCYTSGKFNKALLKVLDKYEIIQNVMLKTLREERKKTYSSFLPIRGNDSKVLQVKIIDINKEKNTISYLDENAKKCTIAVTDGNCKLQWKPDWAMRWYALDVDYEMCGKDVNESVRTSSAITRILGGIPPCGMSYELFLDKDGKKISKSKGNGITIDEWLNYGPWESLSYFMYIKPTVAKKLYYEIIPKSIDEYISYLKKYESSDEVERLDNPVNHIHQGNVPNYYLPVSFSLLLNLVSVIGVSNKKLICSFISRYSKDSKEKDISFFDGLIDFAVKYANDFINPNKINRDPNKKEKLLLIKLRENLKSVGDNVKSEDYQTLIFNIGKESHYDNIKDWFLMLYEVFFGQKNGPRMGSFIELYGKDKMIELINTKL